MELYGQQIIKWDGITDIPASERKGKILDAVAAYMKKISSIPLSGEKFSGIDSNLMGPIPVVQVISDTLKMPDRGYEAFFEEVDMRNSTNSTFDLLDVSGGVTFYQQLAGESAKLSKLPTTALTAISYLRFTGGFSVLDDWIRFNQWYKIDQLVADTVRRWWDKKAAIFYGLITAATSNTQAFATDDVGTINAACANILTDLAGAGYVVDEGAPFYILCHPLIKARIMKALAAAFLIPNSNNSQIVFNIAGLVTSTKMSSSYYWVISPNSKLKRGEWEDLNARPAERDELKLGADHVWTGAYNGAIGEAKQIKRCALS